MSICRRGALSALFPTLIVLFGMSVPLTSSQSALVFQKSFSVDVDRYMGVWYELARTPNRFQDSAIDRDGTSFDACYNATAEYRLVRDDRFSVTNRCERASSNGVVFNEKIDGIANITAGEDGRKFKLAFGSGGARFAQRMVLGGGADYWVYCLGPVNGDGVYDWAVAGGSKQRYAFLLTRDKFVSDRVAQEMLSCAAQHGFDTGALVFKQQRSNV